MDYGFFLSEHVLFLIKEYKNVKKWRRFENCSLCIITILKISKNCVMRNITVCDMNIFDHTRTVAHSAGWNRPRSGHMFRTAAVCGAERDNNFTVITSRSHRDVRVQLRNRMIDNGVIRWKKVRVFVRTRWNFTTCVIDWKKKRPAVKEYRRACG